MSINSLQYQGRTGVGYIDKIGLLRLDQIDGLPRSAATGASGPLNRKPGQDWLAVAPQTGSARFREPVQSTNFGSIFRQELTFVMLGTRNEIEQALDLFDEVRFVVLLRHRDFDRLAGLPNGLRPSVDFDTGDSASGGYTVTLSGLTNRGSIKTTHENLIS